MNLSRSATAYSLLIAELKSNNGKAIAYAQMINECGVDDALTMQICDTLINIAMQITPETHDLFIQVVDVLNCISEKEIYKYTAQAYLLDTSNIEGVKNFITKILSTELHYQGTSFEIDLLNRLVAYVIYIKDAELLDKIIEKINALGAQL